MEPVTTERLLESLPAYLQSDPLVQRIEGAFAAELELARQFIEQLRDALVPTNASEQLGTLSLWERTLRLPVDPPGLTEAQRRAAIVARIGSRRVDTGARWTKAALGIPGVLAVHENTPGAYQLTVDIAYAADSPQATDIAQRLRAITPAHIEVILDTGDAFIASVDAPPDVV